MNTSLQRITLVRRIVLLVTAATGTFVGAWAAGFPQSFYDSFPGFGFIWISIDGSFNEHLIRDVGALYLAIAAIALYAVFARSLAATRATGIAWVVFGVPHLTYHLLHLEGLSAADVIGNVVSLGASLLLGVALLVIAHLEDRASHAGATLTA